MRKVKQLILIISGVVLLFGIVFTAMNVGDGPQPRFDVGEGIDDGSFDTFAASVTGPANFDKSNAFYRLWSLTEPAGTDIEADETLLKYRRLHDPAYDTGGYTKEWNASTDNWQVGKTFTGYFSTFKTKRKAILKKYGTFDSYYGSVDRDWPQFLLSRKAGYEELYDLYHLFLERYKKLVESPVLEEFTIIRMEPAIAVPDLLAWLHVGRLYISGYILEAMEGNWQRGADGILAHLEMCKRAIKGSRTLIFNLVAKALLKESLYALAGLMNQPDCPNSFYQRIIRGMPVLKYDQFGTRVPLLLEGYNLTRVGEGSLLYHKNRTRQYYCDLLTHLVKCDAVPAYRWKIHPLEYKPKKSALWWMQNPEGKAEYEKVLHSSTLKNLFVTIYKSWAGKALYDMTRISAELHLAYTPGKTVKEVLESLDTYKTWLDHGSGQPYKWHKEKQILYSFGIDTDDDNGGVDRKSYDTDIPLPVVVFIK